MTTYRQRNQRGQAVVIVVAIIVSLTVLGVMVFDAGLAMSDRRNLQAYADAAALAGARSYGPGGNNAHWVAMQYLGSSLGFSLPAAPCGSAANCPAGTYTVSGYTITLADSWRYNSIFNYPTVLDVVISHRQPSILARMVGFSTLTAAASARATNPGPQYNGANYAVAAVNGDAMINGGGAAFQTVTGPVYAYGSFGANNAPHSTGVPSLQTNYDGTTCGTANHLDNGGGTNSLDYHTTDGNSMPQNPNIAPPNQYDYVTWPALPTAVYSSPAAAQDAQGHWKPGTYNGFAPSGGTMNGGIYKIINASSLALGNITNTVYTPSGTADTLGAVAILLDGSDTGGLDLSNAVLNGLDDLYAPGPRDPMGTHNFVVWSGSTNPYTAGVTIGPHVTTDMSGIIYLPKSPYVSDGNSSPQFTGSVIVESLTVHGGGNGQQVFKWVCGLNAIAGQGYDGGLVR
ncbi:MAG TPA: pilus assembly protein TadG-related protein [Candidatus Dormibacteraeota bacterium]|nr:pilus assembly protein TadG-related protein [Candidatus Dormibacteraeota bacterium]